MAYPTDAREMGRRGGRSKSEAKRAAVRRNGLRGGRPRNVELFAQRVRKLQKELGPELPGTVKKKLEERK